MNLFEIALAGVGAAAALLSAAFLAAAALLALPRWYADLPRVRARRERRQRERLVEGFRKSLPRPAVQARPHASS